MRVGSRTSEAQRMARHYVDKSIRKGINQAFTWGQWVAIRSQVRPDDKDALKCVRCWSDERAESTDPRCPVCNGSGWISDVSYTGYRLRVFSQAQIPESQDQYFPTEVGLTDKIDFKIWVNFTERPVHDGDLIAHIIPDDVDNPSRIVEIVRRFEVIDAFNYQMHPALNRLDSSNLLAQEVRVDQQNIDRPETFVNMDENISPWMLTWDYPQVALFDLKAGMNQLA